MIVLNRKGWEGVKSLEMGVSKGQIGWSGLGVFWGINEWIFVRKQN
jgi:hypothetical protein